MTSEHDHTPLEPADTADTTTTTATPTTVTVAGALGPASNPPVPGEHPAAVYLARLAPSGRRVQHTALETIARLLTGGAAGTTDCPWWQVRYAHTQAVRTVLAETYAPATANRHLSALRGVMAECWRLGLTGVEDYRRAVDLAPVRGTSPPAGRALSEGELAALFATCTGRRPSDARDAALLALAYGTGLRRAELVALDVADYAPETGRLNVRRGKGGKARTVWATHPTRTAIDTWLTVRGDEPGPLLCPVSKSGHVTIRRLTGQAVRAALLRRARHAQVAAFSPHDLRRTFVGDLLERGADIAAVQQLAGHASVTTTARYDRRPDTARRRAAELLHIPYQPAATDLDAHAALAGNASSR